MTTGMTKEQTKDFTPKGPGAPPSQPPMRRCRSLSELPGSIRVPILKRTDNSRMRARLEAGMQGLEELRLLREQQQQQMEEVRTTAQQKKPSSNGRSSQSQNQPSQRRMSASMRLSSTSLARINEEGDDNSGNVFSNGNLRDCTNLTRNEPRRHSSFSVDYVGNRRPLGSTDSDVFDQELSEGPDRLRKTHSWNSLPSGFRTGSSESLCDESSAPYSTHFANSSRNNRRNQRSYSFSAVPGSTNNFVHVNTPETQNVNNENIEPKLRRASIQCEAVLTGGGKQARNQGIFKDVDLGDLGKDRPSPLHAVLHAFKPSQSQNGAPLRSSSLRDKASDGHYLLRSLPKSYSGRDSTDQSRSGKRDSSSNSESVNSENKNDRLKRATDNKVYSEPQSNRIPSIQDLHKEFNNEHNFFRRRSSGDSLHNKNTINERHHSTVSIPTDKRPLVRTASDSRAIAGDSRARIPGENHIQRRYEPRTRDSARRRYDAKLRQPESVPDTTRSPTIIAVCQNSVSDNSCTSDKVQSTHGHIVRLNVSVDKSKDVSADNDRNRNKEQETMSCAEDGASSEKTKTPDVQITEDADCELSPLSPFPYHEKKFSIASDEGYVTSPPSTPRGRHKHNSISDSSWISTDLDDTASSCEPSPFHLPRDVYNRLSSLQQKRNDFSHDNTNAKVSRRSSDYGSASEIDRGDSGDLYPRRYEEEGTGQLTRSESCESMPFKQTAV